MSQNNWNDDVSLVIDEWLLLEYACVFLPANQDALVEAVSKGAVDIPSDLLDALGLNALQAPAPHRLHAMGRDRTHHRPAYRCN